MIFKHEPQVADENGEKLFSGFIGFKVDTYVDRLKFIEEKKWSSLNDTEAMKEMPSMVEEIKKRTAKVELKHQATGQVFNSIDDLLVYREGGEIINELLALMLQGPTLGNWKRLP